MLIRKSVFASVSGFDERFNLTGGEDTHFFSQVRHAGHSMVWSRDAIVRESVPPGRAKLAWILRRGYQSGNSWVLCELALDSRTRVWWMRFVKSWAHMQQWSGRFEGFALASGCWRRCSATDSYLIRIPAQ
ncbi:MAG: hypothetical protein AUI36_43645 [Cyanobacteria bacterium 13_1_40CM_2_61_4]|nr:MAG: hypothetical protein AUI36_43645 [Cyanobacteria bacterium 13_1_40CM_2_61_4]